MADYTPALDGITQQDLAATGGSGHTPYDVARLEIDEDGSVAVRVATVFTSGDGVPESVWHGRILHHRLSGNADLDHLRDLLADGGTVAALLDRIIAGHGVEWDGGNQVGRMTDDAQEASFELDRLLEELPQSDWTAWETSEWVVGDNKLAAVPGLLDLPLDATDEQIAAMAADLEAQAEADRVVFTGGSGVEDVLREALGAAREEAVEAGRNEIPPEETD